VHPVELAGGFSDLEMTWLLYCAGTATVHLQTTVNPFTILTDRQTANDGQGISSNILSTKIKILLLKNYDCVSR